MCHGTGSEKALKALRQWTEVYRAGRGLFSRKMASSWAAAKDADPVSWCRLQRGYTLNDFCNSTMQYRSVSDPEDDQTSGDPKDAQKVRLNHFIEYQK